MSDKRPKCPNYPKYPCGDCPVCQVPSASPRLWSWPPGFHEAWPTREAIAAHQGGSGRWLVTDPYGVKTLGAFDGDTFHVLMRWHVAGAMVSEPTQPWKFEPYWKDTFTDEINRQREKRDVEHEIAAMGLRERAPAPPAASDSPGQPQAPTPPQGPAAGPGIAPGRLDAAGFGSWPSEEEIEAHGNGLWLIRQKGEMAPGQIRSMALGRFGREEGQTVWWSGGNFSHREHMSAWAFCPIDDNGDKLDAAPVLRGEDARRLVEQLGQVASPEEIARRREDARRRLAENEAAAERLAVERMSKAGREVTESLRSAQLTVGLWPSQEIPHRTTCKYVGLRDGKACACNRTNYAVPVGPRLTEEEKEIDRRLRDALKIQPEHRQLERCRECGHVLSAHSITGCRHIKLIDGQRCWCRGNLAVEPAVARVLATLPDRSPDRRVLVVLRGLPGSGKSTVAQAIVDSDPGRWARVSKDDVRQMMVGPSGDLFRFVEDLQREAIVGRTIRAAVSESLAAGLDVVIDATNLTEKALEAWVAEAARFAVFHKRTVAIAERAVPTPVEECVARDARRGARSVGRTVIERLAATIDVPLEDRNQEVGQ